MTRRLSLADLRALVLALLDDEWRSPSDFRSRLRLDAGLEWYKLCLVLERLAGDGDAELKAKRGSSVRKYRRAAGMAEGERGQGRGVQRRSSEAPEDGASQLRGRTGVFGAATVVGEHGELRQEREAAA